MTKYQFSLALLTSVMSFSSSLQAACVSGDCTALGYTKSESECGGDIIRCPFDTSKVFCRAYQPTTKVCDTIGDVLYDDKSCAIDINNLDPYRTPIGVVFDVNRKLAIALEQSSSLKWAPEYHDIPGLTNYSESTVTSDYNGKSNTSIIRAHGDSNGYDTPAADYCYNYITAGTNKGDWYLPAGGELQLMYNNKTTLNNSLSKVGGTQLSSSYHHWSSSEFSNLHAWILYFGNGGWGGYGKTYSGYVRPVLAYQRF